MRPGKSGEHKLAYIRCALVDFHVGAALIDFLIFGKIAKIKLGVYALRVHVQPHRYNVQVACALAVAKKRSFYPLRAGKQCKLGCRHAAAAVIVWMNADNGGFSVWQMAYKIFNLICKGVGGAHFHRVGQI